MAAPLTRQLVAEISAFGLQFQDRVTLLAVESASRRGVIHAWQAEIILQHALMSQYGQSFGLQPSRNPLVTAMVALSRLPKSESAPWMWHG